MCVSLQRVRTVWQEYSSCKKYFHTSKTSYFQSFSAADVECVVWLPGGVTEHVQWEWHHSSLFLIGGIRLVVTVPRLPQIQHMSSQNYLLFGLISVHQRKMLPFIFLKVKTCCCVNPCTSLCYLVLQTELWPLLCHWGAYILIFIVYSALSVKSKTQTHE